MTDEIVEQLANDRGGAMGATTKEWVLDDAARARIDTALEEIDAVQSNSPTCVVCGQRTARPDRSGTCSKTTEPHVQHRKEMRVRS